MTISAYRRPATAASVSICVAACAGCFALAVRPISPVTIVVTMLVGLSGAVAPAARERTAPWIWAAAVALGVTAVVVVRLVAVGLPQRGTSLTMAAVLAAAVAEEVFFRRFLYGTLARWGAALAVLGTALAFAVVHVPWYGAGAFPVDLAAGLVFGWQRWTTGSWTAPAATHAAANLVAML